MSKIHWKKYCDSDYLGAWDLPEDKDVVVTIETVTGGELNIPGSGKTDRRPIVKFKGSDKRLVLNATNGKAIQGMYGPYVEDWVGHKIALYIDPQVRNPKATRSNGEPKTVPGIRVRPRKPE